MNKDLKHVLSWAIAFVVVTAMAYGCLHLWIMMVKWAVRQ